MEITIFDVPDQEPVTNKTQKQLDYEELIKQTGVDADHIWSMYEMDELSNVSQRPRSTLPSIMLKYVIQYCMPILSKSDTSGYTVSLQNEDRLFVVNGDKVSAIPANEQFKVTGIKIPSLFLKNYNKFALVHYDHISDVNLALSGRYGLVDLQTMNFTQQRYSFTHPGLPNIGEDKIIFTSDEHVLRICIILLDYIDFIEQYYRIHYPLLRYDLVEPSVFGTAPDNWQIINGRLYNSNLVDKKQPMKVTPTTKPEMFVDFSPDLLKTLNAAQNSEFGSSFYYDILYMLDANKLTKLYNISNIAGDTDEFKKELAAKVADIQTKISYQKQVNAGHKTQLLIVKKKSIAYDKFGITNLTDLSTAQLKIVELELTKLESKANESGAKNRSLFSKLKSAMLNQTSDELKSLLRDVEKTISSNELNQDNLLPGGVCPHTYHYAKKTFETFDRPVMSDMRDFLIERFALPANENGYFCKICGELIVESDSTSVMKFSNERGVLMDESPLQTMIWKEAMYIVSTNVRFITPMPIKPLVSSLASGLREAVAHEEAKLYRSKTTLGDSVKDVLNLYAAIYIYAALCALMMQNPGKLMFAREPPAEKAFVRHSHTKAYKSSDTVADAEKLDDSEYLEPLKPNVQNVEADDAENADNESSTENMADSEYLEPLDKSTKGKSTKGKSTKENKTAIAAGPKRRRLRYIRGGKVVTDVKLAEKFYLTTALKLIFLTKETIISRLPNMSADVIKQIFIKNAYAWAVKHAKPINVDSETNVQTSENPVYMDAFYRYVQYMKSVASNKHIDINDIKTILGRDEDKVLADFKNGISIYSTVEVPKQMKSSKLAGFDEYAYLSFMSILEYYQEMLYTKSRVPQHVQVSEYLDKYAKLLDTQDRLTTYMKKLALRPNIDIPILNNIRDKYNNFAPNKLDLAKHFCPNGDQHKTGTYMYTDGKKEMELSKKDIVGWITSNDTEKIAAFANMKIIDERCEKCKVLVRTAKSLQTSDFALQKMFNNLDDLIAFYQYYETRCPKGNLHDIVDNTCSKCKFHTDYPKSNDPNYYEKNKSVFQKVQREKQSMAIRSLEKIAEESQLVYNAPKPEEYKFSLRKTAEWSQISGVKYNLIINIGLYEKIKFVDIENAVANPSKTVEPSKSRAMRLRGHIHSILRDYTMLLNNENVVDMPLELKEILDAQKKIDIKGLRDSMPDFNDFPDLDSRYSVILDLPTYTNFLQEYLAEIMTKLNSDSHEKYTIMAKALILHFTNSIIAKEKFISKPEPVFMKKDITTLEDNSEDEVGVSGDEWAGRQSEPEDDNAEDATETYENEISHEAFDVEDADAIWDNE